MSEQKEKKLKEEDLKLLEENKKRREEIQRFASLKQSNFIYHF